MASLSPSPCMPVFIPFEEDVTEKLTNCRMDDQDADSPRLDIFPVSRLELRQGETSYSKDAVNAKTISMVQLSVPFQHTSFEISL